MNGRPYALIAALLLAVAPAVVTVPRLQAAIHAQPPAAFRGARVLRATAKSINNTTTTCIDWSSNSTGDAFDIGGFWASGAATRFTIPAGVNYVELTFAGEWAASTARKDMTFFKNGAQFLLDQSAASGVAIEGGMTMKSGPISVVAGDYFEACVWQNSGGALNFNNAPASRFAINVLG